MKNKMLFTALVISSIGVFVDARMVFVGVLVALTGLFIEEEK